MTQMLCDSCGKIIGKLERANAHFDSERKVKMVNGREALVIHRVDIVRGEDKGEMVKLKLDLCQSCLGIVLMLSQLNHSHPKLVSGRCSFAQQPRR